VDATTAQALREQVAWACRILALEGYLDLTLGHVSAREPGGTTVYIKRKGVALDEVGPDDVVEFDLDDGGPPSSPDMHLEAVLHSEVYRRRPDVGAVVHGHPPYATALSATEATLETLTHDAVLFADGVGVFGKTPQLITDSEQARAVAEALGGRRAVLLGNHGVLVVGKDVPWAALAAVTLERAIRIQSIASTLGPLRPIPAGWAQRMQDEKYRDRFVEEYWEAWIRRARRAGAGGGMPSL
jgi:L-fuculose-phosphate aldolase